MQRTSLKSVMTGVVYFVAVMLTAIGVQSVAPTKEALELWREQGILDRQLTNWNAFKASGGCAPSQNAFDPARVAQRLAAGVNAVDTLPVLVIMVDFSDKTFPMGPVNGTVNLFDSILFSDKLSGGRVNPSGSMIDYYREITYGAVKIKGLVVGPFRMPWTYATYVGSNTGFSLSPTLARHAVDSANRVVNFQDFRFNGVVQGVVILHPGVGAETGDTTAIWSHKSNVANGINPDGVAVTTYTMDPEEFGGALQPIGVFCHEHGHIIGLPDLYDVDYTPSTSEGLGSWSLMASGNYNGDSRYPAHPDPWCKIQLGINFGWFSTPVDVTANLSHVEFPAIQYNPVVYKIKADKNVANSEYWLVENRQKMGFDSFLPGEGLLIYHVDPLTYGNTDHTRYGVGLEQADGLNQMALSGSSGDASDPWPGSYLKREFTDQSVPNSHVYADTSTQVGVWNISNSDSIMTADLDYEFSRPFIQFDLHKDSLLLREAAGGNGDSTFDAGETVELLCRITNTMRSAYEWSMTLSSDNSNVEYLQNDVYQTSGGTYKLLMRQYNPNVATIPVRFRLKAGSPAQYTQFTLTIKADSLGTGSGIDSTYRRDFQFTIPLGTPQVLVVDDDNSTSADSVVSAVLRRLNVPSRTWSKSLSGSPTGADLSDFVTVFWVHGAKPTGTLTSADVTGMKAFLNGGGSLCMASATAAKQLSTLDSAFLRDYMHARFIDTTSSIFIYFFGTAGGHLNDTSKYQYRGNMPQAQLIALSHMTNISSVAPGQRAFTGAGSQFGTGTRDTVGVTYSGSYKTVLLNFPIEFIADDRVNWGTKDTLVSRILAFLGGGAATSVGEPSSRNLPRSFTLGQNYPNPFNPNTIILYSISPTTGGKAENVELTVFNMLGERVKTLVNEPKVAGNYKVEWNGTNSYGTKVATGIYFYRLMRGGEAFSRKMLLLK